MPVTRARWRSDPESARQVIDSIFEETSTEAKKAYCQFLAGSIAYLSQDYPDRWGITLFDDAVRLNAGIVEVLVLHRAGLNVLIDKKTAPAQANFNGHRYVNAPGCEMAAIPVPELARTLPRLTKAHQKALEIAASRRKSWRNTLSAHSPGVTKWLSQVLRREVPNPTNKGPSLHIVQGGIDNGDKALLERIARGNQRTGSWMTPKSAAPGDEIVIYIRGFGFFATALVNSQVEPSSNWKNRYRADLKLIDLIRPPISLAAIRRHIPDLEWAKYPRSITTPPPEIAGRIRVLIRDRRKGEIQVDDELLPEANMYEARMLALLHASPSLPPKKREAIYRTGANAVR